MDKPPSLSLSSVMHPFIKKKEEFDVILSPTSSPHSSPLSSSSSSSSPIPSPSSLSLSPNLNSDREKLAKQRLEQYQIMNKQPTTSSSPSSIANIHVRQISPSDFGFQKCNNESHNHKHLNRTRCTADSAIGLAYDGRCQAVPLAQPCAHL